MEESRIIYNIPFVIPFGAYIATYFYITGLHMGFYTTSVVASLMGKVEWKPIGKIGAVGAVVILATAPLFLLIDLEEPARFWKLFVYLNPASAITWGTFFLTTYPLIGLIYAWHVLRGNKVPAIVWGLCGFPIAISVHGYTGFILALSKARELWNSSLSPTLFLVSAMVSGLAIIIIIANIRIRYFTSQSSEEEKKSDRRIVNTLIMMMIIFIIIDIFLLGCEMAVLGNSTQDGYSMYKVITTGTLGFWFLGVELFLGEVVPLAMLSFPHIRKSMVGQNIACLLVLMGIFVMRMVIVIGGQSIPLH